MGSAMRRTCAAIAVTLMLGMLGMSAVFAQQSPGRWVTDKYAKVPVGSEEYTNTVLDNKLYLMGGNNAVLTPGAKATHPARVLVYDLAADKWTQKKRTPFFADHMTAAGQRQDLRLRRLGRDDAGGTERHARHRVGIRHRGRHMEGDREADGEADRTAGAAAEVGGKIYFIGGSTDLTGPDGKNQTAGFVVGTNESFDPATNKWETHKAMPTPRNHPAIGVVGGKIYLIGGRITANNIGGFTAANVDVVEEYSPATDSWRAMNRMPTPRSGEGWATYEGKIYVAGGEERNYHIEGSAARRRGVRSGGQRLVPAAVDADRAARRQRGRVQRQAVRHRRTSRVCGRRRPRHGRDQQRGVRVRVAARPRNN